MLKKLKEKLGKFFESRDKVWEDAEVAAYLRDLSGAMERIADKIDPNPDFKES